MGWILGIWGVYISVGLFVLYTVCGFILFQPKSNVDQQTQYNASKMWTYSVFWVIGSLLGQLV